MALQEGRPRWQMAAVFSALLACFTVVFLITNQRPVARGKLVQHLPHGDRVLFSLDVKALRAGGILSAAPNVAEEADYKAFVAATGFDYQRDLDHLYLSVGNNETYAWVVGRFDWKKLQGYAQGQGGKCEGGICRLASPAAGRTISFRRNGSGILAFASSPNPDAVRGMFTRTATAAVPEPPKEPVWFLLPQATLRSAASMPAGSRMFLSAISEADHAFLSIGAKGDRFEATLDALTSNDQKAQQAVRELQAATTVLNRMLAREKQQPNARDLSGVLTRGEFRQEGVRVKGTWPLEKEFLQAISLGGSGAVR